MQLSRNFHLDEFEVSETAERLGHDNRIPEKYIPNVFKLAATMQNIRNVLNLPVVITSGYRCPPVNKAVGGAKTSDHIYAAAADFICPAFGSPYEICRTLSHRLDELGIRQLILEYGRWVHVGIMPVADINRMLTIDHHATMTGFHLPRTV